MAIVSLYQNANGVPSELEIGDQVHEGGEGCIYFSKDGLYAIKIYHPWKVSGEKGPQKRSFLEMITMLGNSLTPDEAQFLCWPVALIRTVGDTPKIGCVTRRIHKSYKPLVHLNFSPKKAREQFLSGLSWSQYLQIARGIARSVAVLHGRGCAHADLSYNNFLVNTDTCNVVLLDLDGLVVPGFLDTDMGGTSGIIAPEIIVKRIKPNESTDRHSLAVQVLQTLLFRNVFQPLRTYDAENQDNDEVVGWGAGIMFSEDPKDRRNRPPMIDIPLFNKGALSYKRLTPGLQKLTERACIEGLHDPNKRPSAREWINTLSYALDEIYQCSYCHLHFPYPHWLKPEQRRSCPFCGQRITGNLPSVFLLYEPRSQGKYTFAQRFLVLGNGWHLFPDVIDMQRTVPMSRRKEISIGHLERDEKNNMNRLVNDEDTAWHTISSSGVSTKSIDKGASIPLYPGTAINFGEGRRLLLVEE